MPIALTQEQSTTLSAAHGALRGWATADLAQRVEAGLATYDREIRGAIERLASSASEGDADVQTFHQDTMAALKALGDHILTPVNNQLNAQVPVLDAAVPGVGTWLGVASKGWQRELRGTLSEAERFVAGFLYGGGVQSIITEMGGDEDSLGQGLQVGMAFLLEDAQNGAKGWRANLVSHLDEAFSNMTGNPAPGAQAAPSAAPAAAKDEASPEARLKALLALAKEHKLKIAKVPTKPSTKWLDKTEAAIQKAIEKRLEKKKELEAKQAETGDRNSRLAGILAKAKANGIRISKIPKAPSDRWLDRTEAKIDEVIAKKQAKAEQRTQTAPVPEPEPAAPAALGDQAPVDPIEDEGQPTQEYAGPTAEELQPRLDALIAKAEKAGMELGRIPSQVDELWLEKLETKVDEVLEEQKAARKAERKRKQEQRKRRIERLREDAATYNVDIGRIPPFPTEDWLARAELRVQEAAHASETDGEREARLARERAALDERRERLENLSNLIAASGQDIEIPPDPDDEWIMKMEQRLALMGVAAVDEEEEEEQEEKESAPRAELVYEEGTLQEEVHALEGEVLTIGRGRRNDVQLLQDGQVSRQHCKLFAHADGRFTIVDSNSTTGTWVDGQRVDEAELTGGEVVKIGETLFAFRVTFM